MTNIEQRNTEIGHWVEKNKTQKAVMRTEMKHVHTKCSSTLTENAV